MGWLEVMSKIKKVSVGIAFLIAISSFIGVRAETRSKNAQELQGIYGDRINNPIQSEPVPIPNAFAKIKEELNMLKISSGIVHYWSNTINTIIPYHSNNQMSCLCYRILKDSSS